MALESPLVVGLFAGASIALGTALLLGHRGESCSCHQDQCNGHQRSVEKSFETNGFTLKEAKELSAHAATQLAKLTPEDVINELQRGNTRFAMGNGNRKQSSALQRQTLLNGQYPSVAVLACADSRVPVEIIFDQGVGDVFTICVAGNCLDKSTEGSLEYGVAHLDIKVLIVMGHEGCGAIKAAQLPAKITENEPKCLRSVLKGLKGGLDMDCLKNIVDDRARDREAVMSNVKFQMKNLLMNEAVQKSVEQGKLQVIGAFYNMSSGIVDFYK
jgi:carbonic anhydrase